MRPAPYTFEEPTNLTQAFVNLKDGMPIAGGQNLMPALRMRQIDTPCLVSLEKIESFSNDILVTVDAIQIGALTTISELLNCAVIEKELPWLHTAASKLGDTQVKNLATVVGNVCWSDPRANMSIALLASRAEIKVVNGKRLERSIPIGDFFTGFQENCLDDELVSSILIPRNSVDVGIYDEFSRQPNDLALVNVCAVNSQEGVTTAIGGTSTTPIVVTQEHTDNVKNNDSILDRIVLLLENDIDQFATDQFGSSRYRLELVHVLLKRALPIVVERS
jgi:carbon-monoxide dehydrogenase medium subunit